MGEPPSGRCLPPKTFEPMRGGPRVVCGVLWIAVAEIVLDRPHVLAGVGQGVTQE